jgi:hypothetical protein
VEACQEAGPVTSYTSPQDTFKLVTNIESSAPL